MKDQARLVRNLDLLKPEFSKAMNREESHPEFAVLFDGLVKVTYKYDLVRHEQTPITELRETLERCIATTKKLRKLISSLGLDNARAIDLDFWSAFDIYAKEDLGFEEERNEFRNCLKDLQRCDDECAGINVFMDNLLSALIFRNGALPKRGKGDRASNHPHIYYLVELAKIADSLGMTVSSNNTIYYRYCQFFLTHVTRSKTVDISKQVNAAAREFKKLLASKKTMIE
jgi:hypothetical protein